MYLSNAAHPVLEADIILLFLFFSQMLSYYLSFVQQTYLIYIHSYTIIMALTEAISYQLEQTLTAVELMSLFYV